MERSYSAHVDTFTRDRLPPTDLWPDLVFGLPELRYEERLNCAVELLDATVARLGADRPCLVTDEGTWTYGDLLRRSDQVARVLTEDLGLVPGNRVLLRGPNAPWLVACWFGVIKAGGVAVTTMPMLRAAELRAVAEISRPALALCDARFLDELERAGIADLGVVPYGGESPDDLAVTAAAKPAGFEAVPTAATDVCLLAFTSGTTGRPKATMHFHRDLLAICDTFSRHVLRPRPDDLFAGTPPVGFTFGLGALVAFPLRVGAATFLLESGGPDRLREAIGRHGITVLSTAPPAYRALAAGGAEGLGSLRRCVSAGETLPKATWEWFDEVTGIRIIDGIGSTEMLHIFIAADGDRIRPGATGLAVPGYEARVIDPDRGGVPVPDGDLGHLAVRGPTGCRYLGGDRQRDYVREGWNITGDLYVRHSDGYFWFQSRADDMIVASGYNVAGPEVEAALLRHPAVVEAAVVSAPDPERRSQLVKAFVVLREGTPPGDRTAEELRAFVKRQIAPYKCPRQVEFVAELPRTATGKLQRFRLRG